MKSFKIANSLFGWLAFVIAAFTYVSTVEPTASFWDCPEFISTAYKLEVGHPPGAPFFMLTGNLFSQFASDPSQVAFMVNVMSALLSAMCILFLFWSITHLARKLICTDGIVTELWQTVVIIGSGLTGALAYTWSDTFWFSAVEGEVYAYSSMFTALVFWLILKWEDRADQPGSDRWLILIFYLTGLSIGVHLLNLLCLPAIVLVYYYKKTPDANVKGSLMALCVSMVLVAAVLYGVVPGIVKVGGWFELFFVNVLGCSFNTGMIIYLFTLTAVVLTGIYFTTTLGRTKSIVFYILSVALLGIPFYGHGVSSIIIGILVLAALSYLLMVKGKDGKHLVRPRFLNTSLLCMLMLMIGYSSYAVIVIRSTQNTPMDQDSPEDIFSLGTYLNREQYGTRPLFFGQAFTSQVIDIDKKEVIQPHDKVTEDEPDRYDVVEVQNEAVYPSELKMLFPRMYSSGHTEAYKQWLGGVDLRDVSFYAKDQNGRKIGPYQGQMPSQWDNIRFFLSYQINFMYWRYFMWNFAGRQNDVQGLGEPEHGNWITGIKFIDDAMLGCDTSLLPKELQDNKGHNVFYCLPLILGLMGLFWQVYKGQKGAQQFWVVFFLFLMTGLAIVLYLNQTPGQPRERDYAYAGSFYAFCIWVGLGVAALAQGLERLRLPKLAAASAATLLCLLVPLQMVSQTWDDHDRSGRYACRDFGANYLNTLPEGNGPIIFTNGDNDTFPLWYTQDTEGERTDARVCNLSYLQTAWYTDQMKRPAYDSPALPIKWHRYEYADNVGRDYFEIRPLHAELNKLKAANPGIDPYEATYIIDNFLRNKDESLRFVPTDSIVFNVNREAILASSMKVPYLNDSTPLIPEKISISLKGKRGLYKKDALIYEMLARGNWERPMYMSVTIGESNFAGFKDYLVLEGLAYRITPFKHAGEAVDADLMYDNMMNKFRSGNVSQEGIYLDETVRRMCLTHRGMYVKLAKILMNEGKTEKALAVVEKAEKDYPSSNIPYTWMSVGFNFSQYKFEMPDIFHKLGKDEEATRILCELADNCKEYLVWYNSFKPMRMMQFSDEIERQYTFMTAALRGLKDCGAEEKFGEYQEFLLNLAEQPVGRIIFKRHFED